MYVYLRSEPGLWTVGFYDPKGQWHAESDHTDSEEAANRVAYLNGIPAGGALAGALVGIAELLPQGAKARKP